MHQLDLSICEGKKIFIGYKINITVDELDLYNSKSPYYNDLCYPYTNSKGTDVILNDRQIEYINNNKSSCDENCEFSSYDKDNGRLICSCEVKHSISLISDIKVDKNKLYVFIDFKNIMNFTVMKCINLLFSFKGFKTNIGFYSFLPTIISYFLALFILCFIEFKKIKFHINEIIAVKKFIKLTRKRKPKLEENLSKKNSQQKIINFKKNKKIKLLSTIKEETINSNINSKENKSDISDNSSCKKYINIDNDYIQIKKDLDEKTEAIIASPPLKKYKKEKDIIKFNKEKNEHESDVSNKILIEANHVLKLNKVNKYKLSDEQTIKIAEILKYNDNELNDLGYKKAFKSDKRNFFEYYLSLLFTKHIIFQIFNHRDYNAYSIKVLLLFFNFSSCYAINALFFNDDTMHQIYEDEGVFNFIYQLPQIAYSTIISYFVDNITTFLALSEDNILQLKQDKKFGDLNKKSKRVKNTLKIKFILFFIVNIILILLFWYYLGCFCAVYKNTQYHLIKDTIISFGFGFVTPFGTNIIIALLRIYSLKNYNKSNKIIFKLSKLLQQYL